MLTFGSGKVCIGDNNNAVLAWNPDGTLFTVSGHRDRLRVSSRAACRGSSCPATGRSTRPTSAAVDSKIFDESTALAQSFPAPLSYMGTCGAGANQMSAPRGVEVSGEWSHGLRR